MSGYITSSSGNTTNNSATNTGGTTITTPSTEKHGGVGVPFTPRTSGKVQVVARGSASSTTAATTLTVKLRYGTGSAPALNAAATGTQLGSNVLIPTVAGVTFYDNFCFQFITPALTIGTQYWFDVTGTCSAGSADFSTLDIILIEL